MHLPLQIVAALIIAGVALSPVVEASKRKSVVQQAIDAYQLNNSFTVPAAGKVEVAFSPNEGGEHLVIKVIDSAKSELDLLSYSFTSVPIVEALVRARHRGVKVTLYQRVEGPLSWKGSDLLPCCGEGSPTSSGG